MRRQRGLLHGGGVFDGLRRERVVIVVDGACLLGATNMRRWDEGGIPGLWCTVTFPRCLWWLVVVVVVRIFKVMGLIPRHPKAVPQLRCRGVVLVVIVG